MMVFAYAVMDNNNYYWDLFFGGGEFPVDETLIYWSLVQTLLNIADCNIKLWIHAVHVAIMK